MNDTTPKPEVPRGGGLKGASSRAGTGKSPTREARRRRKQPDLIVGWREWVGLPALNIDAIRAKIDTGARSSSLHAKKIQLFDQDGQDWVRFEVVLDHAQERGRIPCIAPVSDIRSIKNSFGVSEERVIIRTLLQIGAGVWPVEVSLADRENMTFPALLGRTALRKHAVVDPGRSYLCKWIDEKELPKLTSQDFEISRKNPL
jgi:hypothetical protein